MGERNGRRLSRKTAGLPQPDKTGLLVSAGGARDKYAARETTAAGASFFAFLSHVARSQYKKAHFTQNGYGSEDTQWLITLPQIGGHEEEKTHNEWCAHEHCCKLGGAYAPRPACTATQM